MKKILEDSGKTTIRTEKKAKEELEEQETILKELEKQQSKEKISKQRNVLNKFEKQNYGNLWKNNFCWKYKGRF